MSSLIELYRSVLPSVGLTADEAGFVSTLLPGAGTTKPFMVDTKRLVLPTAAQLKEPDWSNRVGFHPLLQNLTGGESRVMEKFRDRANTFADFALGMLFTDCAQLAVRAELHQSLTPKQAAYLNAFSDADEKFVKLLLSLVATKRLNKKNFEFIKFTVIKGREWQGQKRSRVAVTHFPLYDALPKDNKPATVLGHKLRIADVKMIRSMYEFLFDRIKTPHAYEVGSDSKIAPSLESFMAAYGTFVDIQNTAIDTLENVIGTAGELHIVSDWKEGMSDVSKYLTEIRKIPNLEGNAPSERLIALATPRHISDATIPQPKPQPAPTAAVVGAHVATISAETAAQHEKANTVQDNSNQPRFKLGMARPANVDTSHQLVGDLNTGVRVATTRPLEPTPPVGTYLAQQNPDQTQQALMHQQLLLQQQQRQQQAVNQVQRVPESVIMINGNMYVPLDNTGVSAVPPGAILYDDKTYMPYFPPGTAPAGVVLGAPQYQQQQFNPPGQYQQPAQITDPSQIPGLSQADINFFRSVPAAFQQYLANQQQQGGFANNQVMQPRQAVPRYLQQNQQQANVLQQQANSGFIQQRPVWR